MNGFVISGSRLPKANLIPSIIFCNIALSASGTTVSVSAGQSQVLPGWIFSDLTGGTWHNCCFIFSRCLIWPKKFSAIPVETAIIKPAMGRITVMTGSSIAHETAIESTPDSGVAIINERDAPLLAPCFFKPVTTGITPHDHSGIGIPKRADRNTGLILPLPRCFFI